MKPHRALQRCACAGAPPAALALAGAAAAQALRSPTPDPVPLPGRIEVFARGLEHPWGIVELPDGRLLVTERPGRLRLVRG